MGKRFKLTEEQYNILKENGVTLTADLNATNGNVEQAVANTKKNASDNGINPNKVNIQIPASESKIITKKTIYENRLKSLKETSKIYTIKDFMKNN